MPVTVQDFKTAWADKPNRDVAYALAEQYVAENAATLEPSLGDKSSDEIVQVVELCRAAGNDDAATAATMYELVKFERRQIGGEIKKVVSFPAPKRKDGAK